MKFRLAKALGAFALGWLGGTAVAGQPLSTTAPPASAPTLIQQAPPIPSLGQAAPHAAGCATGSCATCAPAAPERCFIPPMIGDMFFGGLRGGLGGAGGGRILTRFVGYTNVAAELIPINLVRNAPRATFDSVGLAEDFISVNPVTGLTNRSIIALQPNQEVINQARTRFPGATFVQSQAVPRSLITNVPGLENLTSPTPAVPVIIPPPPPVGIVFPTTGVADAQSPYPGTTPNQDLTLPGGGPLTAADLYVILNTLDTQVGAGGSVFLPEPGGFSRYTRISENGFVLPTDRIFTNYNYLNGVLNGADVNAFMVGAEKTFLDGQASIQLNVPIYASTLASAQYLDGNLGSTAGQFGNLSVWLKFLLLQQDDFAISAGVGVNTPTAEDVRLFAGGNELLRVRNETVFVNPFVGALWTPSEDFFVQGFSQLDIDTWGNTVVVNGNGLGRMRSAVLWSTGVGTGYVLYNDSSSTVSSVIPMAELHYTTNLGNASTFNTPAGSLTSRTTAIDTLNLVAGVNVGIGQTGCLTVGGGVPLIGSRDRQYDWQVLAQLNFLFGGPR